MSQPTQTLEQSETLAAFAAALAKAQGAMENAKKDALNPHFKTKYADLASVVDACRAPLSANGIAIVQRVRTKKSHVLIETLLLHASGEWMSGTLRLPAVKADPQGFGSAITYARRYALAAMVGVAPDEDDDGNAASGRTVEQRPPPQRQNGSRTDALKEQLRQTQPPKPGPIERIAEIAKARGLMPVSIANAIRDATGKTDRAQLTDEDVPKFSAYLDKLMGEDVPPSDEPPPEVELPTM
jgi:hypothetical protein